MKRHGVAWCVHCGYHCPVREPVTDYQQDALNQVFWEMTHELEMTDG